MKTKKFYSFLLAACCVMTMVSLTSCHPDDEDDDNNGNGGDSKTKIEYVEFKEPCLMKGATKDEVMAWMAVNMPEYVSTGGTADVDAYYKHKDNHEALIAYHIFDHGLSDVVISGPYQVEQILDVLDMKYGNRTTTSGESYGATVNTYTYFYPNTEIYGITVMHQYGFSTLTKSNLDDVSVGYIFSLR